MRGGSKASGGARRDRGRAGDPATGARVADARPCAREEHRTPPASGQSRKVLSASNPPKPSRPMPARPSTVRSIRSPTRRRSSDTPPVRTFTHAMLPSPTPASSVSTAGPSVAPAVLAAANTAAHDAIVSGFEAGATGANTAAHDAMVSGYGLLAPSAAVEACFGGGSSSPVSPPSRIRNALHSVF